MELTCGYTPENKTWVDVIKLYHNFDNLSVDELKYYFKKLINEFDYIYLLFTHEIMHSQIFVDKLDIKFNIINDIIKEFNVESRFFVFDNELNKNNIKFHSDINYIGDFIPRQITKSNENSIKKHFVCHNNQRKIHRDYVVEFIKTNNIDEKTFLSYHMGIPGGPKYSSNITEEYTSSFCNIVTETYFLESIDDLFGFSEKLMKPIVAQIPFIIVGQPHSLKKLKELGFKTFSDWWDESYDNEMNHYKRLQKIFKVIHEISKWPLKKCNKVYNEMNNTLIHNSNIYKEFQNKYQYLYDIENHTI